MMEANRGKLLRLLAGLFALLGSGPMIERVVWRKILVSLVAMESGARRLIYVLARDLDVVVPVARTGGGGRGGKGGGARNPVFAMVDRPRLPDPPPRRCPQAKEPRVTFLDDPAPRNTVAEPADEDLLDASTLERRLKALQLALNDLPAQAQRLMRWYGRNVRAREAGTWRPVHPFRMGRPPGSRERGQREAHGVLDDCHDLAVRCLRMLENERYGG